MFSVASLLNPMPPSSEHSCESQTSTPSVQSTGIPTSLAPKKPKMSKSAVIFVKAEPKGDINYKPCELQSDTVKAEHEKFQVEPIGRISEYPRHIPYNSEKKSFQQRTGRDAFEAYQYTFRMPDESPDKEAHTVMWDYNVGLVRMTSFFKSLKHSKTMPAKVMNANPGLKEVSHSITGGSIGAQGYWVPYEAAKSIAATFCWHIRYVLTPVFGLDFPAMCTEPDDPAYLRVNIDRKIILRCAEAAEGNRARSQHAPQPRNTRTTQSNIMKTLRPKPAELMDTESGYCTDTDRSLPNSPQSGCSGWTPVNMPTSGDLDDHQSPTLAPEEAFPTNPPKTYSYTEGKLRKRLHSSETRASDETSPDKTSLDTGAMPIKRRKFPILTREVQAAYTLMQLHMVNVTLPERSGLTSRRASH